MSWSLEGFWFTGGYMYPICSAWDVLPWVLEGHTSWGRGLEVILPVHKPVKLEPHNCPQSIELGTQLTFWGCFMIALCPLSGRVSSGCPIWVISEVGCEKTPFQFIKGFNSLWSQWGLMKGSMSAKGLMSAKGSVHWSLLEWLLLTQIYPVHNWCLWASISVSVGVGYIISLFITFPSHQLYWLPCEALLSEAINEIGPLQAQLVRVLDL